MTDTRTCNSGDRRQKRADCKGSYSARCRQGGRRLERGRRDRDRTDGEKDNAQRPKRGVDIVICGGLAALYFYSRGEWLGQFSLCFPLRFMNVTLAVDSLSPRPGPGERSEREGETGGYGFKAWG
jgi:hypothetical protein